MAENYYTTRNYKPNHSTFGGRIYDYDFYGHPTMSDIAERIMSDWKFDEKCRKNIEYNKAKEERNQTNE